MGTGEEYSACAKCKNKHSSFKGDTKRNRRKWYGAEEKVSFKQLQVTISLVHININLLLYKIISLGHHVQHLWNQAGDGLGASSKLVSFHMLDGPVLTKREGKVIIYHTHLWTLWATVVTALERLLYCNLSSQLWGIFVGKGNRKGRYRSKNWGVATKKQCLLGITG